MSETAHLTESEHDLFAEWLNQFSIRLANIYLASLQWTKANIELDMDNETFAVQLVNANIVDADSILTQQRAWIDGGKQPVKYVT